MKIDFFWRRIFLCRTWQGSRNVIRQNPCIREKLQGPGRSVLETPKSHLARVNRASQIGFQCQWRGALCTKELNLPSRPPKANFLSGKACAAYPRSHPAALLWDLGHHPCNFDCGWGFSSVCFYTRVLALALTPMSCGTVDTSLNLWTFLTCHVNYWYPPCLPHQIVGNDMRWYAGWDLENTKHEINTRGEYYSLSLWLVSCIDIFKFIKGRSTAFSRLLGT